MTTTEIPVDPFRDTPIGTRLVDLNGARDQLNGIRVDAGNCGQMSGRGYTCTRTYGHSPYWDHVACDSRTVIDKWGRQIPPDPDPAGQLTVGDAVGDRLNILFQADLADQCRHPNPDGTIGHCTRIGAHSALWPHVFVSDGIIRSTWGGTVGVADPFASATRGQWASDMANWRDPVVGVRVEPFCREQNGDYTSSQFCTRPVGHPGQHISTNRDGRVLWTKPPTVSAPVAQLPYPPADGTPVDVEGIWDRLPDMGTVARLRDRSFRMYVLGHRSSGTVEALDIDGAQVVELPIDLLVHTDPEYLLTDELGKVAQWYATYRDKVRRVAVREYRNDRWCMSGLNQNLRTLGLKEYTPELFGRLRIEVPFTFPDVHAGQSDIERLVKETLADPALVKVLAAALPPIDGMTTHADELRVQAVDFSRK